MECLDCKFLIDSRIKRFIEGTVLGENDEYLSIHLSDIDMSFWFNNYTDAQEFLNKQAVERVYDKSLRKGYFDYLNDHNEKMRIFINGLDRGKITDFEDVSVA